MYFEMLHFSSIILIDQNIGQNSNFSKKLLLKIAKSPKKFKMIEEKFWVVGNFLCN